MADLRTLAQAVVDAGAEWAEADQCGDGWEEADAALNKACASLAEALGGLPHQTHADQRQLADTARAILAVDAQGYARAMGEVVSHAEVTALGHRVVIQTGLMTNGRVRGGRTLHDGANNALVGVAGWARERAAVAERD